MVLTRQGCSLEINFHVHTPTMGQDIPNSATSKLTTLILHTANRNKKQHATRNKSQRRSTEMTKVNKSLVPHLSMTDID